ncbi:hypothetical protein [Streptomyces sp. CoH27]|uniref:hypothetical protein n=1 Tax=Streptomyces sp. CoH27 TaxID=2875763 RepID=UPI001CD81397|nr:hypothetical protein [Streptomyces sp. CoH27]
MSSELRRDRPVSLVRRDDVRGAGEGDVRDVAGREAAVSSAAGAGEAGGSGAAGGVDEAGGSGAAGGADVSREPSSDQPR